MAPDCREFRTFSLFAIRSITRITRWKVLLTFNRSRLSLGVAELSTSPWGDMEVITSLLSARRSGISCAISFSRGVLPFIEMTLLRTCQVESRRFTSEIISSPLRTPLIEHLRNKSLGSWTPERLISPTVSSMSVASEVSS